MSALKILYFGLTILAQTKATEIVWAVIGRPVTLNCDSGNENCFLISPLREAFDRSKEFNGAEIQDQCNLKLLSVQERDLGEWSCIAGSQVEKVLQLSQASQPQSVRLERISESLEARCVVEKAKPRPKFAWYIDDVLLENINATDVEGTKQKSLQTVSRFFIKNKELFFAAPFTW